MAEAESEWVYIESILRQKYEEDLSGLPDPDFLEFEQRLKGHQAYSKRVGRYKGCSESIVLTHPLVALLERKGKVKIFRDF
jgi:hypothetical protein